MIEDVSRPEHHKSPPRDAAKQLQQAAVSRPVNSRWPGNRHGQARSPRSVACDAFALELCHLIDVARPQRRILVGRWVLDVAVHAYRAAMHETADAGFGRCVDQLADGCGIHGTVGGSGNTGFSIHGGDVINDVDPLHGARQRPTILQRANQRLDPRGPELLAPAFVPRQAAHVIAALHQRSSEVPASEPGDAGN
jgi:hypothetical protein